LAEVEKDLRDAYFRRLIGRPLRVLIEGAAADRPGWGVGTACRYAPVDLPLPDAAAAPRREFREVIAVSVENGRIVGQPA
jgi:hypothetical protein